VRSAGLALIGVVLVAAVLRFWGIELGLPFTMGRPDEREALAHTVTFPDGDLNPRWLVYPNFFFWIIWLWGEAALALLRTYTDLPSWSAMLASDMATLLLIGRVASALVGIATVVLVWEIGRRLDGPALGLAASFLLSVCFLHVRDSHALKADVWLTFAVPPTLWLLARYAAQPSAAGAARAGAAIGLATSLKYPGILLLAPAWHAARLAASGTDAPRSRWRELGLLVVVAVVVFLVLNPFLVLDGERLRTTFTFSMQAVYGTRVAPPVDAGILALAWWYATTRTFGYHLAISLRYGFGLGVALVTPVAVALGLRSSEPPYLRLAAGFCVIYYVVTSLSQVGQSRYLTPLMPLIALLVSRCVLGFARRIAAVPLRPYVAALVLAALAAEPAVSSVAHDRIAARADTRAQALRWMTAHLPANAVVARLGSTYFPIADPEVPPGVRVADLPLWSTDLDAYGVTHVITHEHPLPFSRPNAQQLAALAPRLEPLATFSPFADGPAGTYEDLDAYYVPIAHFAGVRRPGPLVRIYRWKPAR
jgi:4-amino-4-deoxy-L-arabinose transferase-like glycosyltransferase